MRNGGKISASIDVLTDVLNRHQPVKSAARDWGKRARYAGRKASASPATGLASRHVSEQGALVADALGHSVREEIRRQKKG